MLPHRMVTLYSQHPSLLLSPFQAEGLTAIEAWVIACIIFVFGALGEYTVILLKIKLKKIQSRKPSRSVNTCLLW